MKPLTIEELKALEVGDWVWLIDKIGDTKSYWNISENTNEYLLVYQECYCFGTLNYADYGTKWLAYKNKEQAEAKGEIVELREPRIEPSNSPYGGYTIHWQKIVEDYGWCRDRAQAERHLAKLKKGVKK